MEALIEPMDAEEIFEILMRDNADMLLTYLRSVAGSSTVVDELFQETMITAWKKLDQFDRTRPFGPWLRGIARRLALAYFRKGKQDMLLCSEEVLDYLDAQVTHLEERPGDTWQEKIGALHACIGALPGIYHQVIELRYLDGLRPREIVTRLSLSREAVKKRLHRARMLLLSCLQQSGTFTKPIP